MLVQAIYAQIFVVCMTMFWLAFCHRRTPIDTCLKIFAIAVILVGLWLGGVWFYPPTYGLFILAIILIALVFRHFKKPVTQTSLWRSAISNIPALFLLLPLGAFTAWQGLTGRLEPVGEFVDLQSPFAEGREICVLSGGISPLLNFHIFPSDKPRDLAQIYALDFIGKNSLGFRTVEGSFSVKPKALNQYTIYGEDVFAPCAGLVVKFENNHPEQPIGGSDKVNTGGNGIVLQCGNYHVHLHHLKKGSVLTPLGSHVTIGQKLGVIGNSGNTIEPHLHFHAETIIEAGNPNAHGDPVHMRIDGRFLARGDCL